MLRVELSSVLTKLGQKPLGPHRAIYSISTSIPSSEISLYLYLYMTALRCLSRPSSYPSPRRTPSLLFCFRGISSKLFVKGISFRTTEESLSRAFSQFGKVLEARVIKNKVTNRNKGFAYVTFREENEAQNALEEMNGKYHMDSMRRPGHRL